MAAKKLVRKCVIFRRQNPMRQHQLMGDLPEPSVNPEYAFYHCGVNYTGFVEVKANEGRGIKTAGVHSSFYMYGHEGGSFRVSV